MADGIRPPPIIPNSPVPTLHRASYPAISPTRPELSAAGKNILITGGGTGIGLAIAKSYATAGARNIILTGRRAHIIEETRNTLSTTFPSTKFHAHAVSTHDRDAVFSLFSTLRSSIGEIDILILNAGYGTGAPAVSMATSAVLETYTTNVFGNLNMVSAYTQPTSSSSEENKEKEKDKEESKKPPKTILDVSTVSIHQIQPMASIYGASKASWTMLLQRIGIEDPELRVHSYHPGAFFTDLAKNAGIAEDALEWDEIDLAGDFAVWLASEEARFLSGRFVWAHWDVQELKELRERVEKESGFLTMGLSFE
ncbi:MAG: hypothetical protein M1820_004568 [Bogoriella megaspora]|nr:MAG: hypothetical protein M1820_004568 [Bogoriella megaspora]